MFELTVSYAEPGFENDGKWWQKAWFVSPTGLCWLWVHSKVSAGSKVLIDLTPIKTESTKTNLRAGLISKS